MRSFVLTLIALVLAYANAQEFQRHRVANNVRGINSKYMDLASEVDAEIQQRVQQRRFLMGSKKSKSEDDEEMSPPDMGAPEMGEPEMSMSMSMSM